MLDETGLFLALRQRVDADVATAIERLVRDAPDSHLNRINPLSFAAEYGIDEGAAVAGFLHATQIGLFELSWNVVCGGCGGTLHSGESLKIIDRNSYSCAFCGTDCEPELDERVEVTFTIDPRVRKIAAHDPDGLPLWDYIRQIYWSSGNDLPGDGGPITDEAILDAVELAAGAQTSRMLEIPEGMVIIFDPVTHGSQVLEVSGTATREPQHLTITIDDGHRPHTLPTLAPGPLELVLQNKTAHRVLPILWLAGDALVSLVGRRIPVLSANRLLTHQTFRDLYRTDVLDINQRFRITNLTFLFTDLKGSTELYERIGDLAAFDLIRAHFRALMEIISDEDGAVVKTIGDAVMATFPTPSQGIAAALRMRDAMKALNDQHGRQDMLLKIGVHTGPCLAVMMNERQDYFGQTVNIASRVQGLAAPNLILTTASVGEDEKTRSMIERQGIALRHSKNELRGIGREISIYEIT